MSANCVRILNTTYANCVRMNRLFHVRTDKGEVKNICTNGVVWYSMQITNYTHGPNRPHSETQHSPCGHNFFTVSWITASRHIIRYAHGGIQVFKLFFGTHVLTIPVHIT